MAVTKVSSHAGTSLPFKHLPYSFCFPLCNFLQHFLNILEDLFYNMKLNTKALWKHVENKCTMAENCSTENDSEMLFSKIQDNILLANTCQDFQNLYT